MVKDIIRKIFKLEEKATEINTVYLHDRAIGSSGIEINAGYIAEEYLQKLRNSEKAKEYDKMRRSDAQVKMCISAVKNPILRGNFEVQPAAQEDVYKRDAEFIDFMLFNDLGRPFSKFLSEALTLVEFGHSVFEMTDKVAFNKNFGKYNGIANLGWRSPKTIERWNVDKQTEKLISISQYAYGDLDRMVDIPAEFLLLFTMEREGANFEGISMLRPCYGNYFRKNIYLKLNAIGIERSAIPTLVGKIPQGKEVSQQATNLMDMLEKYLTHQNNYFVIPSDFDIKGIDNSANYDPAKVETSIDNEDKRMVKAFLANFLELGMSGTGAYALSNDLSDFFLSGIEHIAQEVVDEINHRLIPRYIKMNFGERDLYPKLTVSGISDKAGEEFSRIITILAEKKVIIPDDELEKHVRNRYGLPEASLVGQRKQEQPALFSEVTLSERIKKEREKIRGILNADV